MLELVSLSYQVRQRGSDPRVLLDNLSLRAPGGHFMAVLGATGSGKSVLLRVLAGQLKMQSGALLWHGRDRSQEPWQPNEVAYVTNDTSALQPLMSVKEQIMSALMLQVAGTTTRDQLARADQIMALCGLDTLAAERSGKLSEPQQRRLLLALALAGSPLLILCDDLTAGLDPKSQREMTALMNGIAKESHHRLVINATQSLADLSAYDSVVLLHEGRIGFHGPGRALTHYFSIPHTEDVFHRLAKRPSSRWQDSWNRHRDSYYAAFKLAVASASTTDDVKDDDLGAADEDEEAEKTRAMKKSDRVRLGPAPAEASPAEAPPAPAVLPGLFAQLSVLLKRRWTLLRRSRAEWWVHAALLLGLPLVVMIFGWNERESLALLRSNPASLPADSIAHLAWFVSGFTLLQVLIMTCMSVKNASREVASERSLWMRERGAGVRPVSYAFAKITFAVLLALLQGWWLGLFVDMTSGGMPGNGPMRVLLLMLHGVAFSMLSLGISAMSSNADRASARSWALAFAQAPLCGALVALPAGLGSVLKPFVTAYHSWSGSLDTLQGTALFTTLDKLNGTWFAMPASACIMLLVHAVVGLALLIAGLSRRPS